MQTLGKLALLCGAGVIAVAAAAPVAQSDEVSNFYKRKRITLYVGYSPGAGYDLYARTLARHMGQHIPGKPRFVVKNRTGAGSLILANEMYSTYPRDGSVMATIGRGLPTEPLFGNQEAKYDPRKLNWIGSMNNEVSVCAAWHTVPVNIWEDMKTRGMIVGGTGAGSDTDTFPTVLNNLFGTKLKLITGYPGGADINLAIEKGEVEGRCGWSWSSVIATRAKWLKEKKIKILLQMSTEKHKDLPTVPFVLDLATNQKQLQILKLVFARQLWGRPFFTTQGVPRARVEALRAAFDATMKDPKFLAETKKLKMEINPVQGQVINDAIAELYRSPKDIVEATKQAVTYKGNIQISKAVIPIETVKGKITRVRRGGSRVSWGSDGGKKGNLRVSGRNTEIMIGGKKGSRKALKVGMNCTFTYQASAAKKIDCQ